jgi:uncharacterized Zn-binding protein involved in type VI secretion
MGKLAARMTDTQACPLTTGSVPHVGGAILSPCSFDVPIENLPAARLGDLAVCIGPPNVIALGSFAVLIGRQPAARQFEPMAHGGKIVAAAATVYIGDKGPNIGGLPVVRNPDGTYTVGKNINVDFNDPTAAAQVLGDLATIAATPAGLAVLQSIDNSGHKVTIHPTDPHDPPTATTTTSDPQGATAKGTPLYNEKGERVEDDDFNQKKGTGTGADSSIAYNPGEWPYAGYRTDPPGDVGLFHELEHADHNATGTTASEGKRGDAFDNDEEYNTINQENDYRDQRGHPRRTDHHDH